MTASRPSLPRHTQKKGCGKPHPLLCSNGSTDLSGAIHERPLTSTLYARFLRNFSAKAQVASPSRATVPGSGIAVAELIVNDDWMWPAPLKWNMVIAVSDPDEMVRDAGFKARRRINGE